MYTASKTLKTDYYYYYYKTGTTQHVNAQYGLHKMLPFTLQFHIMTR